MDLKKVLADVELLDAVRTEIQYRNKILNMNDINTAYVNILEENDIPVSNTSRYKQYLKDLILANMPDVKFNRPLQKNKPEQVMSTKTSETAIAFGVEEDSEDDLKILFRAAHILRREVSKSVKWKFEGSFDNYSPPKLLEVFCKLFVVGSRTILSERKVAAIDTNISILAQYMNQTCKSDRQVFYGGTATDPNKTFYSIIETPLSVGLAIDIYKNLHFINSYCSIADRCQPDAVAVTATENALAGQNFKRDLPLNGKRYAKKSMNTFY